jgi:16S rRNA (guanine1516-N2)-methyltransferase
LSVFVTTAQRATPALLARVALLAEELQIATITRRERSLDALFEEHPEAERLLLVQTDRLLLVGRGGWEFFFHPNLGYMRMNNLKRGQVDYLVAAAQLGVGDSILDATLGFGAEATLCATVVGESGEVHAIEAIREVGVVVREGLQHFLTRSDVLNAAMRRVCVVHLGHHLEFLRNCPDRRYDVVYFDPFFDVALDHQENISALRAFGEHAALLPESIEHSRRISRRCVVIKTARHSPLLDQLGVTERLGGRCKRVTYGVLKNN